MPGDKMTETIARTYRIPPEQRKQLEALRKVLQSKAGGQHVSWQLVLGTAIQAGLRSLGYEGGDAQLEG
jgi:hypothetical protein